MRTNRVLATAAAAAVAVIAVTGGAAASASAASPSPSTGKGSASCTVGSKPGTPVKDGDQAAFLRQLAASLHVSEAKLENALRDMKTTAGPLGVDPTDPRVVAVFAKDLGISDAKALEVIKELEACLGKPDPGKPGGPGKGVDQEALLRKVAASLHVSLTTLENALRDMKMTSGQLGVDPADPRVVAVFAKDLGISDAKALEVIKEIVGQPGPVKSPPPGKTPPPSKSPAPAPSGKA
jgi:hypothetical protein